VKYLPCPANSYEKPTDHTICVCNGEFQWNASKTECLPKSKSTSSSSVQGTDNKCGAHSHYDSLLGCRCDVGYSGGGRNCVFAGCPSGYDLQGGVCNPSRAMIDPGIRKNCLSRNPCVCPTGYKPMANRTCIPN
jgi:hypothetical protein